MKKNSLGAAALLLTLTPLFAGPNGEVFDGSTVPTPAEIATAQSQWTKITLTNEFWAESASAADVNHDGSTDVLTGPFWYEGPAFTTRHDIYSHTQSYAGVPGFLGMAAMMAANRDYEVADQSIDYSNNFQNWTYDVNRDGWMDYIVVGFHGKAAYWYENPKNVGSWIQHLLYDYNNGIPGEAGRWGVGNESPMFVDITGDGNPEILCMSQNYIGYIQQVDLSNNYNNPWTFTPISAQNYHYDRYFHGIGCGDVDKDGRVDILTRDGWWKQPNSLAGNPVWNCYPNPAPTDPTAWGTETFGIEPAQMFVQDINGDGLNDIICTEKAHHLDLQWYEQLPGSGWTKHLIIGHPGSAPAATNIVIAQMHGLDLVDMNSDGIKDIIVGKRLWAHGPNGGDSDNVYFNPPGGDAGMIQTSPTARGGQAVLYWLELQNGAPLVAPGLVNGTNVLSVEVHQENITSSDMAFGMRFSLSSNGTTPVASADTDKDGQPDNFEALFGTSASSPNSSYKITPTKNGSNQPVLTFPTVAAKYYRVEYSDNPNSGWKTAATILAAGTTSTYTDTTASLPNNRSYRVSFSPYCVEYGDKWKFFVPTSDPGTSWRNIGFDDSSWGTGAGLLGFETATLPGPGIQTAVGSTNQSNVYLFRKTFTYSGNPAGVTFTLDAIVDDGATFYLNGNLLGSIRHVPGAWNNNATAKPPGANGDAVEELNIFGGTGTPTYTPHLIDNQSGVGTAVKGVDVNGDGKMDVVSSNKHGAFVFLRK